MKEIYTQLDKESSIVVVNSEVHALRKKTKTSTGIRIFENECIGIAGAQGSYDEQELIRKAKDMLSMKIPYPYALSSNRKESVSSKLTLPGGFDLQKEVAAILAELTSAYPEFSLSNKASVNSTSISLQNELGLDLSYHDEYILFAFMFKHKSSANIMDGYFAYYGREYDRELFISNYKNVLKAFLTEVDLPEQEDYPIIFLGQDSCTSKLNSDLNGMIIGTGSSLLAPKIGQDVFSKDFTLWQTNHSDDTITAFFDMEGIVNDGYRLKLIENGKLLHGYTDKETARKYNMPLTGAASGSYDSIPKVGSAELMIQPSNKTLVELLNGKLGIVVYIASGGDFTFKGDFGTPVQLAFLSDGVNLLGKLPELNIKSNLFDMFGKDFIGVSKDKCYPLGLEHYHVMNMGVSKIY